MTPMMTGRFEKRFPDLARRLGEAAVEAIEAAE